MLSAILAAFGGREKQKHQKSRIAAIVDLCTSPLGRSNKSYTAPSGDQVLSIEPASFSPLASLRALAYPFLFRSCWLSSIFFKSKKPPVATHSTSAIFHMFIVHAEAMPIVVVPHEWSILRPIRGDGRD
jgi:hypothetical protein